MKQVKSVIFDWAGTLIDFGCLAPVQVFVEAFRDKNINITIEEARVPMGLAKRDHIVALLAMDSVKSQWNSLYGEKITEEQIDQIYVKLEPALTKIVPDYSFPNPYVVETLNSLRNQGIKLGSTTGYVKSMMQAIVPLAEKNKIFLDAVVDSSDCEEGRPFPYMIQKNMEIFQLHDPTEIVKVGDTIADVREGLNAGVWTIGITSSGNEVGLSLEEYGKLSVEEKEHINNKAKRNLLDAGAHFVITEMSELTSILDEINIQLLSLN